MNYIPNTITCLNLLSGCIASVMALEFKDYKKAFFFILFACICDFLDGLFARLLKVQSKFGIELDSLADIISFGITPSYIVYVFLKSINNFIIIPYFAFLLTIFAALRLARFNINTQQTTSFLGLPVPSSALFWAGFIPFLHSFPLNHSFIITILILLLIFIFCFLMISSIPMFSLKFKNLEWKNNRYSFYLIFISIIFFLLFLKFNIPFLGVSLIVVVYIILSVVKHTMLS